MQDLSNSRLGRIADEYSRLANLNNYRMRQLQIDRFAFGVDHTALTALLPSAATVAANAHLFESPVSMVITKSTFSADLVHPLATGWINSDPLVGVSKPAFFGGDLACFTSDPYVNRLAFSATGCDLMIAALLKPCDSLLYYRPGVDGFSTELFRFGYRRPPLGFLNDAMFLCERNRAAWGLVQNLDIREQHALAVILEVGAADADARVRNLGYMIRGF